MTRKELFDLGSKIAGDEKICIKCENIYNKSRYICHCDNDGFKDKNGTKK